MTPTQSLSFALLSIFGFAIWGYFGIDAGIWLVERALIFWSINSGASIFFALLFFGHFYACLVLLIFLSPVLWMAFARSLLRTSDKDEELQ